jgi:hypothetical protein
VDDVENQHAFVEHLLDNDAGERPDYEFARFVDASRAAPVRHGPQALDGVIDDARHPVGGLQTPILLDIL